MLKDWLGQHKFEAHTAVFLAMMLSSIALLFSLRGDAGGLSLILLGIFALSNIFALWIK